MTTRTDDHSTPDPQVQVGERLTLSDGDFALLVLHQDGELPADRAGEVTTLLSQSPAARAVLTDLGLQRSLVQAIAVDALAQPAVRRADLSLMAGKVMRKLPGDPAAARAPEPAESALVAWIRGLGLGKVGFAVGAAGVAVAVLIAATGGKSDDPLAPVSVAQMAAVPGTNLTHATATLAVEVEETEIDSGTLLVHPPEVEGGATVFWHFADDQPAPAAGDGGEG